MARINFAWVDGSETTFQLAHQREDEDVVQLELEHEEGNFAALTVTIKNPRIGFLHATRKQWVWVSVGSTPLFFGRVLGIPSSINKEAVTIEFQGRPADYQQQKEALAATMRDLPFYDPVWLTPEAQQNPDTVLEARSELWHIDRITGLVSTSHVLVGEDGLQNFPESEIPYDSIDISISQVPARTIIVTGDVGWTQASQGQIELGEKLIYTYTGQSLFDNWPKTGDNLDGGWSVAIGEIRDNFGINTLETQSFSASWNSLATKHSPGDTLSSSISVTTVPQLINVNILGQTDNDPRNPIGVNLTTPGVPLELPLTVHTHSSEGEASAEGTSLIIPEWSLTGRLRLAYNASRSRKESITFTMSAHFQDLVTLPGDEVVEYLSISGGDVGIAGPLPGGEYGETEVPLGDARLSSFFTTARGLRSLEWLILRARAQMVLASRAVEVSCVIPWERAIALSCRMNATINDRHLPGGTATGKIIKYGFSSDGSSATRIGTVTVACSIGFGGTVAPAAGVPDYCDDDYVEPDYQFHTGQIVVLGDSDVGYSPPMFTQADDGLTFPLRGRSGVKAYEIIDNGAAQRAFLDGLVASSQVNGAGGSAFDMLSKMTKRGELAPKAVEDGLKDLPHYLHLRLANLNSGPFESTYVVDLTDLELPQGIDLEAPSL